MQAASPNSDFRSNSTSNNVPGSFRRHSSESYQTEHSYASTVNLYSTAGTQTVPEKSAIDREESYTTGPRRWRSVAWESKPTWYRCIQLLIVLTILILDVLAIRSTIFTPTSNAFLLAVCCISILNLTYRIVIDRLLAVHLNVGWAQRLKNMWVPPVCEGLNCVLFLIGWIWIAVEVFGKDGKCEVGGGSKNNEPSPEEDGDGDEEDEDKEDDKENDEDGQDDDEENSTAMDNTATATTQDILTSTTPSSITATVDPTTTTSPSSVTSTVNPTTSATSATSAASSLVSTELPSTNTLLGISIETSLPSTTPPVPLETTNPSTPTLPPVIENPVDTPPVVDDTDTETEDNINSKKRRRSGIKKRRILGKQNRQTRARAPEENSKNIKLSAITSSDDQGPHEIEVQPKPTPTIKPLQSESIFPQDMHLRNIIPEVSLLRSEPEWLVHLTRRDTSVYPSSLEGVDCGVDSTILGLSVLLWFTFAVGFLTVIRETRENLETLRARREGPAPEAA